MKKYKKRIIISVILIFAVIAALCYQIPLKKHKTMTFCSLKGEQIEVVIDVSWHRYLLVPTKLMGTITINDTVYTSLNTKDPEIDRGPLPEQIKKKIKNDTASRWFVILPENNPMNYHWNCILNIDTDTMNFDTVCMLVMRDGVLTVFYGPAETAEEAEKISLKLYSQ